MTEGEIPAVTEYGTGYRTEYHSVLTRLRGHAERAPDKLCLHAIDQNSGITWGGLYGACNQIAAALAARGIAANDRIVVLTDN